MAVKQPQASPNCDHQYEDRARYDGRYEPALLGRLLWRGGSARRFANDRRLWRAFELNCQVGGCRTAGRVVTQASLYGVGEWCRKSRRQAGRFGSFVGPRKALGESFNQGYTETP